MRNAVTGLLIQVEITAYNDAGQVAGRPEKTPQFSVLEANIPPEVLAWVKQAIGFKEA